MLERAELQAAVAAGVIDAQQGERLLAFFAARGAATRESNDPDDERFRLVGGFNDVFVTIGIVLVFTALAFLLGSVIALPFVGAGVSWGLAEIFTRRRRMALPSIALAIAFVVSCAGVGAYLTGDVTKISESAIKSGVLLLPGAAAILGAGAHYFRFRVPIDVALGFVSLQGIVAVLFMLYASAWLIDHLAAYALAMGLLAFAAAMAFDFSDPARITHRADIAFWLHLVAAPLLVHGILAGFIGASRFGGEHAGVVLAVTLVFTLVALIVDRRAMIVSALAYAGGAIAYLLNGGGSTNIVSVSATLLVLGGCILLLSIGWRWLRALIVPLIPLGAVKRRLPPLHPA